MMCGEIMISTKLKTVCSVTVSTIPVLIFWLFFKNLVQGWITASKATLPILCRKLGTQVSSQATKRLKVKNLRKLGNVRRMSGFGGEIT